MAGPASVGESFVNVFAHPSELRSVVGTHLGWSSWRTVTQADIDAFAKATGDHQWIHKDAVLAGKGPFGSTVAHGFLTLALVPTLLWEVVQLRQVSLQVNYGANRVRFPSPVLSGSLVRAGVELSEFSESPTGWSATFNVTVETSTSRKPACVVEWLVLLLP